MTDSLQATNRVSGPSKGLFALSSAGWNPVRKPAVERLRGLSTGLDTRLENPAAAQSTAADVMRVGMESDSHRANILDHRWTEIGIAVRVGGEHAIYWVQEFGDPAGL